MLEAAQRSFPSATPRGGLWGRHRRVRRVAPCPAPPQAPRFSAPPRDAVVVPERGCRTDPKRRARVRFHAAAAPEPRPPQTATRRRRGATADARPIDSALQPPRAPDRPLGRRAAELGADASHAQLGAQAAVLCDPVADSRTAETVRSRSADRLRPGPRSIAAPTPAPT